MINVPEVPHMDAEGLKLFKEAISKSSVYLEYGVGGSTVYASSIGVPIVISVDSCLEWCQMVEKDKPQESKTYLCLNYCDIGEVVEWGKPKNINKIADFHNYMVMPWISSRQMKVTPDLILVDGRFRVASFLYSLINARVGTRILFDDYANRSYYHVVEQFCELTELRGRMGHFVVEKKFSVADITAAISEYSIIWD